MVREIKEQGHKIFLDLKLHDIPNTVKKAMAVLSRLDVDLVNLHAAGTKAMMRRLWRGSPGLMAAVRAHCGDPAHFHQPGADGTGSAH